MIHVVGLGPGSLSRVPASTRSILEDPANTVIVRTLDHPAALELGQRRDVVTCDDLYQQHTNFGDVYEAIVQRVLATSGPVVYAVPGSPLIGEFAVRALMRESSEIEIVSGESFVDAVLAEVGYDPLDRGLQILNGHELPDPLVLDKPTIIGHLDRGEILGDALDMVARVTVEDQQITLLSGVGAPDQLTVTGRTNEISLDLAGVRTSVFLDPEPTGLIGAVRVMRRLRTECPWDREQTHQSLVKNLIEETYELVEAIGRLSEDDWVGYSEVEDELGDVLLQVLFHSAIARQSAAFDIDGVATVLREKLVRRHPHVFGDVTVESARDVKHNWDEIKASEAGSKARDSVIDGVPESLPALQRSAKVQNRAAKVGFDWDQPAEVLAKIAEELEELEAAMSGHGDVGSELGDLLFSVVNVSRHVDVDPELALRAATTKFETRFRTMESEGPLDDLTLDELEERWHRAKTADSAS